MSADTERALAEYHEWRSNLTPLPDTPKPHLHTSRGRCVYCGTRARRYRATCTDHADLEQVDA